jgi:hypothetical protein
LSVARVGNKVSALRCWHLLLWLHAVDSAFRLMVAHKPLAFKSRLLTYLECFKAVLTALAIPSLEEVATMTRVGNVNFLEHLAGALAERSNLHYHELCDAVFHRVCTAHHACHGHSLPCRETSVSPPSWAQLMKVPDGTSMLQHWQTVST